MFLIVDESFQLSAQNATLPEKLVRAKSWTRALFGVIPELRLQDAFDLAFKNHTSAFPVSAYEIKLAWEEIERNEAEEKAAAQKQIEAERDPIEICPNKENHINELGEEKICNPLNWNEEIILPCKTCRPKAYDLQREKYIRENKLPEEVKPLEIFQAKVEPKPEEPRLPKEEIKSLLEEHNHLIRQIVAEPEARLNLELVFDEGGNCFKLSHRNDTTFSAEVVKQKIASYQKILDQKAA